MIPFELFAGAAMPSVSVGGFAAGDTIDLTGLGFSGVAPVLQGTNLILAGTGGVNDTLTLTGLVAHTQLSTASDGHGGTVLLGTTVPGLITGTYTNGLSLSNPGQNPATLTGNAVVSYGGAGYARALYAQSGAAAWTITNDGTVIGNPGGNVTGIGLGSPGIVINGAPGMTTALIAGGQNGVDAGFQAAPSTVVNYGTIASIGNNGGVGVHLGHGGVLVNDGLIAAGQYAAYIGGNRGTQYAGATGIVINDGTVLGGKYAVVALQAGGTVENDGTIAATGSAVRGIQLLAGGAIVNHGLIAGSATGIYAASAAGRVTIANYGTIAGANGTAVSLGSGQGTLILGPGSVLLGAAGNAGIVKGLLAGDVLDFRAIAGASASFGANNLLSVSGGGASATLQLDPAQSFTSDTFAAVADGSGGTALTLNVPGTVGFGQTLVVSGLVSGITVLSGGTLEVASGGTVVNAVVGNGGLEIVDTGGTDLSGTIQSGGAEEVFGSASGTLLIKGGTMIVEAGGVTQAVVLDDSALQSVAGTAIGTVISASDSQTVSSGGVASATTVSSGGVEVVLSGGLTSNTVIAGGLVDLRSGSQATGSILFTGSGGVLVVSSTTGPAATIGGLSRAATIDLRGIGSAAGDTVAFNSTAQSVTVTSGGVSEVLQVAGVAAGTQFALGSDGAGGVFLHEAPPAPAGLGLTSASDSGVAGDDITNIAAPTVSGTGEAGDTVTLLAGTATVASATVQANGSWSAATSSLADGTYALSAYETDALGNISALSTPLALTIDTAPPVTVADTLTVLASAGATPLKIVAPSDSANPAGALSVRLTGLPGNGTVTLADGTTAVTAGESLSVAQLTGLEFTPAATATGATGNLTYTVADPAGNTATGDAVIGVAANSSVSLYDFVFTYNDGKDYYLGTVADDGSHVQIGESLQSGLGTYTVFANAGVTALPVGTVSVATYSHNGIGEGSPVPLKTAQGLPDGTAGLGSEADAVGGTDGLPHAFSPTQEASFTTTSLYGFVFTYADNKEFYTGTVADDGSFGTTVGSRTIANGTGQLVGTYTVFAEGVTTRASGSVTIDRFSAGDASLVPSASGGSAGLGSEIGTLTLNGAATSFSPIAEPALTLNIPSVTPVAPPSAPTVVSAEVSELYSEVLGRPADSSGLATFSAAILNGMPLATVRQLLATSPEAQNAINLRYLQILDRAADTGGLATYTQLLENGDTLAAVQQILGMSPEAQSDINQLYLDVLARNADPGGMVSYTGALATGFTDLDGVRSLLAHSTEAASDLSTLFQSDIGRAPSAAELAGMEDQLGTAPTSGNGVTQTSIDTALKTTGNAGGYTIVTPPAGSASLTAAPNTPTLFAFDNIAFTQDTIAGFDPTRDTIEIASSLAANLATLKTDTTTTAAGTIITLNPNQSITLTNPTSLSNANFIFKPTGSA